MPAVEPDDALPGEGGLDGAQEADEVNFEPEPILPEAVRGIVPAFEHHAELPTADTITVFLGALGEIASPATTFSPMVGAEIRVGRGGSLPVPLRSDFEHAVFVLDGEATLDGEPIVADVLYYLGTSRDEMQLSSKNGARILLLGGAPFGERSVGGQPSFRQRERRRYQRSFRCARSAHAAGGRRAVRHRVRRT